MDINTDVNSIPLHLQQEFNDANSLGNVAESLAKGVPPRSDLSTPNVSAVLNISDEAVTLASSREAAEDEELRYGDRSILGGVTTQDQSPIERALDRVNQPLDGSSLIPETVAEREANDMIAEATQQQVELERSQQTKVAANEDLVDLHMAMEAAAFQIPPEVNGTLPPLQSGKISTQEDPSLTPVEPSLEGSDGPLAKSVMGMDPLNAMKNEFTDLPKTLSALVEKNELFTYGAEGDAGDPTSMNTPTVLTELA